MRSVVGVTQRSFLSDDEFLEVRTARDELWCVPSQQCHLPDQDRIFGEPLLVYSPAAGHVGACDTIHIKVILPEENHPGFSAKPLTDEADRNEGPEEPVASLQWKGIRVAKTGPRSHQE